MHTWAPSYNQTLPSIYQIVNGLIKFFFYVDNIYIHTHTHTPMFLICTHVCLSSAHSPLLLFVTLCWHQVFWLVQSSVQRLWGSESFQMRGRHTVPQLNRQIILMSSTFLQVNIDFFKRWTPVIQRDVRLLSLIWCIWIYEEPKWWTLMLV